tara:strand:- start:141 stop:473 length:333 start_codon:yes stop_codon:yes gene_type:complete
MKFNKRHIIEKLIIVPDKGRRPFWAKHMAIFNKLLEKFPSQEFWQKVCFDKKYDGMEYLFSEYGLKLVEKKYRDFHYKIPPPPSFEFSDQKLGGTPTLSQQPTNVKDFLQ